eukprot:comp12323_c0_seq1/m.7179 comp12323_c0_seq1/g.7179  ORF comp12323_c0_seq1/g.7179 comp12323_c0_seq1/m.7179 type:complete len:323 (-) comp12323_c0_seq1:55-1023(-)
MASANGDVPAEAPEHCPGTDSEQAGKAAACAGCPNQNICAAAKPAGPDPDLGLVLQRMEAVKHKVLVLSGKGGVGKSTFTAQLAFGLAADEEREVAVMDVDICGPSIPKVMGLEGEQVHQSGSGWSPVYVQDNLAVMSVGFLLANPEDAVIWRGPKKNGMIKQFLKDVDWGTLDYLVVDTPPGTSDEHLSLAQYLKDANPSGALIVTTPQEVALIDVRKEIGFCRKVGLDIIGVVENMSGFVCPNCQTEAQIFAPTTGGAEAMCKELDCPFLGRVPLDPRIARCCDEGKSFVETHKDSPAAKALVSVVEGVVRFCEAKHSQQ